MILTCPQCATGYLVEDSQMPPGGRWVKCAACKNRWLAKTEPAVEPGLADGIEIHSGTDGATVSTVDGVSRAFRNRAVARRRTRQAAIAGAAWGSCAVVMALIVGAAVLFRQGVVRALPGSAGLYSALGMPVNSTGLVIEGVRAEPTLTLSHAALKVTGDIRNIEDRAVYSPPLRIVLYNARGKRVAGQIAVPANGRVTPGRARQFTVVILDPPLTAYALEVGFAPESARRFAVMQPAPQAPPSPPPSQGLQLRGAAALPPNG